MTKSIFDFFYSTDFKMHGVAILVKSLFMLPCEEGGVYCIAPVGVLVGRYIGVPLSCATENSKLLSLKSSLYI